MTDHLTTLPSDPSVLMKPDASRLRAFADGLAENGEDDLSALVRTVADGLVDLCDGYAVEGAR